MDSKIVKAIDDDFDLVLNAYQYFLPHIAKGLNDVHKVNMSNEFWNILLGCSLLNLFSIVRGYKSQYDKSRGNEPDMMQPLSPPWDAREVYVKLFEGEYQGVLNKDVLPELAVCQSHSEPFNPLSTLFFKLSRNLLCVDIFLERDLARSLRMSHKSIPVFRMPGFSHPEISPNMRLRQELVGALLAVCRNEFEIKLAKSLFWGFPISFLEYFNKLYSWGEKESRRFKCILFTNQYISDCRIPFLMAWIRERGGVLLGRPHGCLYGMTPNYVPEYYERMVSDYYLTWGWSDNDLGDAEKCVPMPEPSLSAIQNSHLQVNKNIIWITNTFFDNVLYITRGIPLPCNMHGWYASKYSFLEKIPEGIKEQIIYRPHPSYYVYGMCAEEENKFALNFKKGKILLDGPLREYISKCMLIMIDHPGTTLQQAMAMDIPCICFWNPLFFVFRKNMDDIICMLHEAKIYHSTPSSLAGHLASIENDVSGWWNSENVQKARLSFVESFARVSKDYRKEWESLFEKFNEFLSKRIDRDELNDYVSSIRMNCQKKTPGLQ